MQVDVILLLRFLLLGSLAIILPFILVKLYKVLDRVQKILEDFQYLSDKATEDVESNDDFKNMVSDIGSQTITKSINSQARTLSDNIADVIYKLTSRK